ncbi:enoyl-CoA hydratase/isomerase family protein [Alcaligenaceae bacterium]|nr:enoyl-CoA hydratase/isomerase family protein [Alcaligenaceae bacterium]
MIETAIENDVLEICMNRPEAKNALTHDMYHQLTEILHKYGSGDDCKAIILYGANSCFTAGADLKDFQRKRGPGDSPAVTFLRAISQVKVPLIAAVEGYAIGIGTTLLQHCDFVYATANVKFRLPFVALGLCPEGGSSLLLEKLVGQRKATEWLLSCRYFDGQEALDSGFITALTESGETLGKAREMANSLAGLPQGSIKLTKSMLKGWSQGGLQEAFDNEVKMYAERLASDETQAQIKKSAKR